MRLLRTTILLASLTASLAAQPDPAAVRRMLDSVSAPRITEHLRALTEAGGHRTRVNFTAGLDSAVRYVQRQFASFPGITSVLLDTFFVPDAAPPYNGVPLFNVLALRPGTAGAGTVIIGAHLDACGNKIPGWSGAWNTLAVPGADDNATGVAVVLEAARLLGDPSFGVTVTPTLLFAAFGAEETTPVYPGWTYGSLRMAERAKMRNDVIDAVLNTDMVGFNSNDSYLALVADSLSAGAAARMEQANLTYGVGAALARSPVAYTWSDHGSFWAYGYPALCLIESAPPTVTTPHYTANTTFHSAWDTLGAVNVALVRRAAQLVIATAASFGAPFSPVRDEAAPVPDDIVLMQNFPNPFNPSTAIPFELRRSGHISLTVTDLLGRTVAVLADGSVAAGRHTVRFDAAGLPAGVYFYRLTAGGISVTKKMLLVR